MKYLVLSLIILPALLMAQRPSEQIREMKKSVLLVRLKTSQKKLEAMRESGLTQLALKTEQEQRSENLKIAEAFENNYDFTPVYFFYSDCSREIIERRPEGCLMNASLEPVTVNPSLSDNFFIAEFWHVEKDPTAYFSDYSFEYDTTGYRTKRKNYYGGTELGPDALILRDAYFRQLRPPFPFYVRTYEGFPLIRRSKAKTVSLLNQNLWEFYEKVK